MGKPKSHITVLIPDVDLDWINDQVRAGIYPSRSVAIRQAIQEMIQRKIKE